MNPQSKKSANPFVMIDAAGLGFCLVLALLVYTLGVHPVISRKSGIVQRQRDLEDKREEAGELVTTLTNLRRELAMVERSLVESPLRLHAVSAVNQRLAMITQLASSQQLTLSEIQPGQPSHGTHYDTVPIAIAGTGNYRAIAAFLHRLHTTFPDTGVRAFSVKGNPAVPNSPATFRFTLAWYAAPIERNNGK